MEELYTYKVRFVKNHVVLEIIQQSKTEFTPKKMFNFKKVFIHAHSLYINKFLYLLEYITCN